MEFSFEAKVVLTLEHKKGAETSKHVSTDFNLKVIGPLQRNQYLDAEDLPTEAGSKVLSNVLVQGLVGNIHMAHEKGFRDSAEHLRWIISELERGFVTVANVEHSNFKS
jgi:hypothetical protein